MTTEAEVVSFIQVFLKEQGASIPLSGEIDFVAGGVLDSFGILSLIMTLETQYTVQFQPEQLADPELGKVSKLAQLVVTLTSGEQSA